jgi:hypothetical protein
MSIKEEIFAHKAGVVPCKITAWNVDCYLRTISARESEQWEQSVTKTENIRAKLVALCLCDEQGKRIFGDEDISRLADMPHSGITEAFDLAYAHNFSKKN